MKLSSVGEFGLINIIKKMIKTNGSVVKGIGDDAAVLSFKKDKYLLLSSDMLIEDVHFNRRIKAGDIGYKSLASSVSDIAAMGGVAKYAIISLGLPRNLTVSFIKGFYKGVNRVAKKFKINIVGGDTNRSKKIVIDVAMIGEARKRNLVLRSGAQAGDLIFVTGLLGGSFHSGKHLRFSPRIKESSFLVSNYHLNSMIDISDGLIQDLTHILAQSDRGAVVYEKVVPTSKGVSSKEAFSGGEDYELLFTMSKKQAIKLIRDKSKNRVKFDISCIGEVTDKSDGLVMIDKNCKRRLLKVRGYRHF